jgi:hypothetical protein
VFLDCLKDVGGRLSNEEDAAAINAAMQRCVLLGIDVCELHHQRKAQAENKKPRKLADVYGNRWLVAGCGSVALLWGEAGDPIVELSHLKQPADVVGPLTLLHDNRRGTTTVDAADDVVVLVARQSDPATAKDIAAALFRIADPSRNEVEKARRRLDAEVEADRLERLDAPPGEAVRWRVAGGHAEGHGGSRGGFTAKGHAAAYVVGPREPRGTEGVAEGQTTLEAQP